MLTYLTALQNFTDDPRFSTWYGWLSDASHPAYGTRVAVSGQPRVHDSGAVIVRFLSRGVLATVGVDQLNHEASSSRRMEHNDVAHAITDSVIAGADIYQRIMQQARTLVEDFALTTNACRLTNRHIWPAITTAPKESECPCGCGAQGRGDHQWGKAAPTLTAQA